MNAAKKMQETITVEESLAHDNGHVAIRIGCHYGPCSAGKQGYLRFRGSHGEPDDQSGEGETNHYDVWLPWISSQLTGTRWCDRSMWPLFAGRADEVVLFEVHVAAGRSDQYVAYGRVRVSPRAGRRS